MYSTELLMENLGKILSLSVLYCSKILTVSPTTERTKGQVLSERFFYMWEGEQTFILNNGTELTAKKGDIVYLPPDVTYISKWKNQGKAISIFFSMVEESAIGDNIFIVSNDKYGIYLKLFLNLADVFEKSQLGYKIKGQSIFWEIYYGILSDLLTKNKNDTSVNKGIIFIENNYMEKINVNDLAKMCFISPATLRRKFKKSTGMSPIEYKNMLKIKKAAELLKTGDFSVTEAAKEVNIDDIYYFSKIFKRYMGITATSLIPTDN